MNYFKDRSTPFLSIAHALLAQKEQKHVQPNNENLNPDVPQKTKSSQEQEQQQPTTTQKSENKQQEQPLFITSNDNSKKKGKTSSSKEESIERENDDEDYEDQQQQKRPSVVAPAETTSAPFELPKNHDNIPPLHLKRFDINGLDRYPITEDEKRREMRLIASNDTGVGVGTDDDPFRTKLAELVRQKNCLLGHHQNQNITEARNEGDREKLMQDLTTLRESLNVLQQMMNCGVDIYSIQPESSSSSNALTKKEEPVNKTNNNKIDDVSKLEVFQINVAPSSKLVTGSSASSSTEAEIREEMKRNSSASNKPYSKFYGRR